jgi:hypothetical protein
MSEAAGGPNFSDDGPAPGQTSAEDDLLDKFARWDVALNAHWSGWVQEATAWYDFVAGRQWTPDEIATLEENSKIPVVFNLVDPVISAVQGAEISNRQQVQYFPREPGDTGPTDALTQGAAFVNDGCDGDQEDSEAFYDTLVCGLGWTETRPEVDGEDVKLVKERVDPIQMKADPAARKRCLEDMRYLKREIPLTPDDFDDFKREIGRPELDNLDGADPTGKRVTIVNPSQRYTSGLLGSGDDQDVVIVCEWQWWERKPVHVAALPDPANPGVTKVQRVDDETLAQLKQADPSLRHTTSTQKVYYRAFATTNEVLFQEELPEGAFRYNCITGKRDRNTGTWFGLVKPMVDPGKFVNKLYAEVLHIIRTNANGGMALEEDAVNDVRQFEESWSATDKVTWLKPGALSGAHGQKMLPKVPPPVQPALFQLMEFARDMVKATTGVSEEFLGLVGHEQAGVLEAQRKKAAYGILSAFFDAKRRYQRIQGRLLLAQIRLFIPDDMLVRIVDKGTAQYVPLAKSVQAAKYDVIVDDAPTGPDQKARVMATLGPLLPQMLEGGIIGPADLADLIQYFDLPASVADKLAQAIRNRAAQPPTPDPRAEADAELATAKAADHRAGAQAKQAKAFKDVTDAHATHIGLGVDFMTATDPSQAQQGQPPQSGQPGGDAPAPAPPTGVPNAS